MDSSLSTLTEGRAAAMAQISDEFVGVYMYVRVRYLFAIILTPFLSLEFIAPSN